MVKKRAMVFLLNPFLTVMFVLREEIIDYQANHPVGDGEEEGYGRQDPVVELPLPGNILN